MTASAQIVDLSSDGQIAAYQAKDRVVVLHVPDLHLLLEVPNKTYALALSPNGLLLAIPTGLADFVLPRANGRVSDQGLDRFMGRTECCRCRAITWPNRTSNHDANLSAPT